ncbi:hypothetical protein LRS74_13275 [Streptomyces sp. LX-29]|uniref:hypothetical protein n=1 Tax=Streptomyces sp. LX-29 TaxID=2900152 RepID=UPI00240E9495|nr:hypothetical protein [Streptomyces sp. LX-29]WFB07913.1 hypothetical protein LRS74_13275 [Streptomyces sp. LX-29]
MARSSTGTAVAALTAAALAGVGFLAYQADATAPDHPTVARADGSGDRGKDDAEDKRKDKASAKKLPADSGNGRRVVYDLDAKRVWLVGADERVMRSYRVSPSSVNPDPDTYAVSSRAQGLVGSDGVQIEHVVVFHQENGVVFGFSAAVDGSTPNPDSPKKTGGIRAAREDGSALWDFAVTETKVVVVP